MIPISEPWMSEKELEYVTECVKTNWISSQGKFVVKFEGLFSAFVGTKYGIATSNGTTALHLALDIMGVGEGDEVIVPTLSFIATANVVRYCGGRPVFVDSEEGSWTIDVKKIEEKITEKTKAIIPVHVFGQMADMDAVMEIAKKHKLIVIEDAAEAHGATYKERMAGSIGDMGCFSFFGNKIVTTGEGGMITTNSKEYDDRGKVLRDHGMSKTEKYVHPHLGYNYRMTNLQAAIGVAQMERVDEILQKRDEHAAQYEKELVDVPGISFQPKVGWGRRVNWFFNILIEDDFPLSRDEFLEKMKAEGVDARPCFKPIHLQPIYDLKKGFPVAERIGERVVNLPCHPTLTEKDVQFVCEAIKKLAR